MKALIPGSFDPITLGHLDIISRAAAKFESVTVAVMTNDMHRYVEGAPVKQYRFSLADRRNMVEAACAHLPNVSVVAAGGLLVKLFDEVGADCIVKGVRNSLDLSYEQDMAKLNRVAGGPNTLLLPTDPALAFISSSYVREFLRRGLPTEALLPPEIESEVRKVYQKGR